VIIARSEGREVAQSVQSHSVFGCREPYGSGIPGDGARGNVVGRFSTYEKTVPAYNGVGGEARALEEVNGGPGVQAGLLVDSSQNSSFLGFGRVERSLQVELQTLGDLVLELELRSEEVGGGPSLGKDQPILKVDVFPLDISRDSIARSVLLTRNFESHVARCQSLDFEGGTLDRVVLEEEVRSGLSEVLY